MRVIAILATFNEERFIGGCLRHLLDQGLEVYLIDNSSTDRTVEIAEGYLGRGLLEIENLPRHGVFSWRSVLERKEELAATLDADWFLHVDADEIRLPPNSTTTLAEALEEVDRQGFNAVNFMEFTFVPTREAPDHDHAEFQRTMRWYYPFLPWFPHRINAWKRQDHRIDLCSLGGHQAIFPGLRMFPRSFPMRHYLFLSVEQAKKKYVHRDYDPREIEVGWHGARATLQPEQIRLPSRRSLRTYRSDDALDPSDPRTRHFLFDPDASEGMGPSAISRRSWPIVVGGCFRSGTSLVRRLLNAHPRIHCGPEVKFFRDFYGGYEDDSLHHLRFTTTARSLLPEGELLDVLGEAFVTMHQRAAEAAGKARWADKAPENVLHLGDWERFLGERWQLIHVVRNPLDSLASMKEARFPLTLPDDLEGMTDLYRRYTEAGLAFAEAHPERTYVLIYERLVGAPERVLHELMEWLGETFHPSQLRFNEIEHGEGLEDPKIAGTVGVHTSGIHRWPAALSRDEGTFVWSRTADLWQKIDPDSRYANGALKCSSETL